MEKGQYNVTSKEKTLTVIPSDSSKWTVLLIVNMGTFMSTLDVGIVNISMPTMSLQLGISLAQIQWIATSYLLVMAALLPFFGRLSDIWSRRKVYGLGFLLFAAGSLCAALSSGLAAIIASRCLQGIGAAMIMANSQAMVRQVFPEHERGRALGLNAVVIAAGTLMGPAAGGLVLSWAAWQWLFWINVPIGLSAFLLGLRLFPRESVRSAGARLDIAGTLLLALGTILLLLAADTASGSTSPMAAVEAAGGVAVLIVLALYGRRVQSGILDRALLSVRTVRLGNLSSFLINMALSASLIPITFYLQGPLRLPVAAAGGVLMAQPLLVGIVAPFAGSFRDRHGSLIPIAGGAACCALSMLFIACMPQITVWAIVLQLVLFGIGTGLFHSANNADIMSAAPDGKISLAGSLLAMVRYFGQIAGIGLAALLLGQLNLEAGASVKGELRLRILFGLCFLACLGAAIAAYRLRHPRVIKR
ncbi:MFS transporter [Paenibacillus sepulcri]